MFKTRTGSFPIGFRRGWSEWQKDLSSAAEWAKGAGFAALDLGTNPDDFRALRSTGLAIGSVDLLGWSSLLSADEAKRTEAVKANAAYIQEAAGLGVKNFFTVMLPDDPTKPRSENFELMVRSLNELSPHLESVGAHIVIEGWPGPGALCCTPEGYRACLKECPSKAIGINYDPSHLLRMGIDPIRFLSEFAPRVRHVHGKDAQVSSQAQYEYGYEQPATFGSAHGFGGMHWRYTIPGHGVTPWVEVFRILEGAGYQGMVCIELEDENFNGSEEGEKLGLTVSAHVLASC